MLDKPPQERRGSERPNDRASERDKLAKKEFQRSRRYFKTLLQNPVEEDLGQKTVDG